MADGRMAPGMGKTGSPVFGETGSPDSKRPRKPTPEEILAKIPHLRIEPSAITFSDGGAMVRGGRATVCLATLKHDGDQQVAVKQLAYHRKTDLNKFSKAFVHEVNLLARLSHPNVVALVGFIEDLKNGKAWMVFAWEANGNVREFLLSGDPLEIPERVSLIQDMLRGVNYLHTQDPPICHGDLKSFNILVNSSYRAVLTDFGSARIVRPDEKNDQPSGHEMRTDFPTSEEIATKPKITITAVDNDLTLTGPSWTLRWVAPEVYLGDRLDLCGDIWAAGWVIWEIMTNTVPFDELRDEGPIGLRVVYGKVPRESGQLLEIIELRSLMEDCWAMEGTKRPNAGRCLTTVSQMPSTTPSGGGSKVRSSGLLRQMARLAYQQDQYDKARLLYEQAHEIAQSVEDAGANAAASEGLGDVHHAQCKYPEAAQYYTEAKVVYARIGDDRGRANTLFGLGEVHRAQSKYPEAAQYYTGAKDIYTRIGNDQGRANALLGLGHVHRAQSKYPEAAQCYTEAKVVYARIGDDLGRANALRGLGHVHRAQSKYPQAAQYYTEAKVIYARIGNDLGRANALLGLGHIHRAQSKYPEAAQYCTEAKVVYARIGDDLGRANALDGLGDIHYLQDQYPEATQCYTEAKDIYTRIGADLGRANTLRSLGHVRRKQGQSREAAILYTQARDIYARIGNVVHKQNASEWLAFVSSD